MRALEELWRARLHIIRLQLVRVARFGDRVRRTRMGSTPIFAISVRYASSPDMRNSASDESFSISGFPMVHMLPSTRTAPALTALSWESWKESKLQAVLPHTTLVVWSLDRTKSKMLSSELRRSISFCRLYAFADKYRNSSEQTPRSVSSSMIGSGGFTDMTDTALTTSSSTSLSSVASVTKFTSALAHTCFVKSFPARSMQMIMIVFAPPASTITLSLPMWHPRLQRACAQ
mmetsp:Transcript_35558/g.48021  ORF Transcript_35558/g.48021 Transcript_35558/m.48021 type:complete len:232 (+) Transcript_35558:325-1020(+)